MSARVINLEFIFGAAYDIVSGMGAGVTATSWTTFLDTFLAAFFTVFLVAFGIKNLLINI